MNRTVSGQQQSDADRQFQEHVLEVTYTNRDDGIWLFCECGAMIHVDVDTVRVSDVVAAEQSHLAEVSRG